MKQINTRIFIILLTLSTLLSVSTTAWSNVAPKDIFMLASSDNSMDQVVSSVKAFVKQKKWIYLGDFKIKKGKVILVKFCVKAAGKLAWKAGLKVSAMLPCGNIGIYQKQGKTEISLLNPHYMTNLYPDPNLESAANLLMPMYQEMLTTIVK